MSPEISFSLCLGSGFLYVGLIWVQAFSTWWEFWGVTLAGTAFQLRLANLHSDSRRDLNACFVD